ncbi:MAG: FG-GAP-like repeat-containing protein [Nitrospirota bacterium]
MKAGNVLSKHNGFRIDGMDNKQLLCSLAIAISCLLFLFCGVSYAMDPINSLKEDTISYFKPMKGMVLSVKDNTVTIDIGANAGVKKGMRFTIMREGVPFVHPVTREPIGRLESNIGIAEVIDAAPDRASMKPVRGEVKEGDIARISEMKVRVLFYQDKTVDWGLGDSYHNLLKGSGRVELIDTALDSAGDEVLLNEARRLGAHVLLALRAESVNKENILKQRLCWVENAGVFSERDVRIDAAYAKELKFAAGVFTPYSATGDALLSFDLTSGAKLITAGDIDGDGKQELIMSTGSDIAVYQIGPSLEKLYEKKSTASDDFIWIETLDINSDGKDEIIVTSMSVSGVVSYIYELKGSELSLLWKDRLFVRVMGNGLIAQEPSIFTGFDGPVFNLVHSGNKFRKGEALKLPKGVNIYDFARIDGPGGADHILAFDDGGYLNLYNESGQRIWRSINDYGGFLNTFKRDGYNEPAVDEVSWSVKDRILRSNNEFITIKRILVTDKVRGLGYKSSQIKSLRWTGFTMEESSLISDISGAVSDFVIVGDKLAAVSRPMFGFKLQNILKGQDPRGGFLYIYSIKGR